ncbi:PREDICTED: transposon [Prunus dulcis]|uniref:PREDICTED: transposon n=1 Tax=Prunus dulcis TaxID=3755 RepID=A0A5E4GLW5_PRUDU|nr:PREDICTED: transposon [Prunus dulcis]
MDKSWIDLTDRSSNQYLNGLESFLDFAFDNSLGDTRIYCPCKKCYNRYFVTREVARAHIIVDGFWSKYKNWTHGQRHQSLYVDKYMGNSSASVVDDDIIGMVHEAFEHPNLDSSMRNDGSTENEYGEGPNDETTNYFKLLQDAECPLYPGCKNFTKLSFIVRLLHTKVLCGWTDKSVTILLTLLKEAFPNEVQLPDSYNEARKIMDDLAFTYNTWDACPNNCMLFRNEDEKLESCAICHESRYKKVDGQPTNVVNGNRKIPAKQVRYFPLKPRLQRLFMSSKTASHMRWHAEERTDDGVLRHPADSPAWKEFDAKNPDFSSEVRNVRLGLSSDGFSPFRTMGIPHSTWPIILMPYNLPPWMSMKQPFYILSVLIDGPNAPGNKIDVYMQPMIDELKELWHEGVNTYDASKNQMFKLRAALLWTISDFPAYANLSGWSTKESIVTWVTDDFYLQVIGFEKIRVSFDGTREWGHAPLKLSGSDVKRQLQGVLTEYKKEDIRKRKRHEVEKNNNESYWKKRSVFFELPYWDHNLIRHNLDVMHIEKNCSENILWTVLGVAKKTKDNLQARRDLQEWGIRQPLHPQERGSNKAYLPPACFTMNRENKDVFLKVLKEVKVPDGYSSNISRRVQLKERTIFGLKSHDHHILMQQLLPIAARRALPKHVVEALIEFTNFFRQLCSKVNSPSDLEKIQDRIVHTLCRMEKIFPMSFFGVMEHLPVHLAEEALIAGAVQFRWMYPIERYLLTLKRYVRNRAHPEASIAKGYLMEECMNFCALYLNERIKQDRLTLMLNGSNGFTAAMTQLEDSSSKFNLAARFRFDPIRLEFKGRELVAKNGIVKARRAVGRKRLKVV